MSGKGDVVRSFVRAERERRGWSLRRLARESDIHVSALSRLESGESDPTMTVLDRLSRAFGVPVIVLLGEESHPSDLSAEEQELLSHYRTLPDGDRREILGIVKGLTISRRA